jgi:hypothetical protein
VENDTFADGDCHDNNNLVFIQKWTHDQRILQTAYSITPFQL